ncbi:hypothetical protein [Methylobacterium gossipiicola]|uniref:hypothetical protein n=1 Tax=Methylobacterium gossipiicola TaxID=582675 RepID=UPI0011607402|nr:hypothetical protein [Methylobacterium gossipiicola]
MRTPRKVVGQAEALLPAVLRLGERTYACTVIGKIDDKTVVNLSRPVLIRQSDPIDIKLETDRTFRRFQLRWKQGLQLSVKPVTTWAAPN